MNLVTDEILFYGGLILAGLAGVSGIIYFLLYRIKRMRLESQMDKEYGEE